MPDHVSRRPGSGPSNLRVDSLEPTTTTPNMRLSFERPDVGTELVRTVSGSTPPASVEVRFEPLTPSEQLTGLPSSMCNAPGPGQALVYRVPVSINGITTETLEVSSSISGAQIRVPIKVKHNV